MMPPGATSGTPGLRASIGLLGLFTLGFGTIIGIGWVTMLGSILDTGGSVGATLAFGVGALAIMIIGLAYAELSSMYPSTGAEVIYAYRLLGPAGAFIAGWLIIAGFVGAFAFSAISMAWLLSFLMPALQSGARYHFLGQELAYTELLVGLGMGVLLTWVNYRGAAASVRLQIPVTIGLILLAIVLVVGALASGDRANLTPHFSPSRGTFGSVAAVLVITPFFYAGFSTICQALAERKVGGHRAAPGAILLGTILCAGVFYCSIILSAAYSAPRAVMLAYSLPAAGAFQAALGDPWARVVIFGGLLGVTISWNALIFGSARVVFTLARAGLLPEWAGRVHPVRGSPSHAVLFIGGAGLLLTCLGRGGVAPIANLGGVIFALLFLVTCLALVVLRVREPAALRPFRVPAGVAVGITGAAISAAMLIFAALEALTRKALPVEWIILVLWALVGIALWLAGAPRRRALLESDRERVLTTAHPTGGRSPVRDTT